jgi:hypothetical protein
MVLPANQGDREVQKFFLAPDGTTVRVAKGQFAEREETVGGITYFGLAQTADASESAAVWQVWRKRFDGTVKKKEFAQKSGTENAGFVHVWDDRTTIFAAGVGSVSSDFQNSIQSSRTSIATTATQITTPDDTRDIILKNNGLSVVWISGDSSVAVDTDGSYPLAPGQIVALDKFLANDDNEIWGIVSTGTETVFTMGTVKI